MSEIIDKLKEREWQVALAVLIQFLAVTFSFGIEASDIEKVISASVTVAVTVAYIWSRTKVKEVAAITETNAYVSELAVEVQSFKPGVNFPTSNTVH